MLDRHKLRFHADYLKARAIYYDNIMVFPDLNKNSSTESGESNTGEDKTKSSNDPKTEAVSQEAQPAQPNPSNNPL